MVSSRRVFAFSGAVFWGKQAKALSPLASQVHHSSYAKNHLVEVTRSRGIVDVDARGVAAPARWLSIMGSSRENSASNPSTRAPKRTFSSTSTQIPASKVAVATSDGQPTPGLFSDLPVHEGTKRAIAEVLGYANMTPVQAQTLPVIIEGFDVLAKVRRNN